jgi:hypothetical protein
MLGVDKQQGGFYYEITCNKKRWSFRGF